LSYITLTVIVVKLLGDMELPNWSDLIDTWLLLILFFYRL
jgi:hypothetical protein